MAICTATALMSPARLEAMADPGSIFVSGAVVMAADRNRGEVFARVGRRRAKNIPELLDVYRVTARAILVVSLAESPARSARYRCALVVWRRRRSPCPHRHPNPTAFPGGDGQPAPGRAVFRPDPRRPAAVSCGHALCDHERRRDQSYFADGLTEDVTTALARNSELQIIARDSTYAVRGQESDVRKLGVKLGVSYVVEGSARREGDQLRVSAQLIDVEIGRASLVAQLRQAGCRRLHRTKRADHGNRRPARAVYRPK